MTWPTVAPPQPQQHSFVVLSPGPVAADQAAEVDLEVVVAAAEHSVSAAESVETE